MRDDNNQDLGTWKAPSKGFFTPLNVAVIFACCIPMGITGAMLTRGAKPPRAIADAPAFKLTNQRGDRPPRSWRGPASRAGWRSVAQSTKERSG